MDGYEHHVAVLIHQLHHLMHPPFVVLHPDKASEYTYTMVDMDHIITYVESGKVIQCKLLALFHRPADTHPVETVENLMVGIAAYFVFMVYEAGVDILPGNEFRNQAFILRKYGFEPFDLGFLFTENEHPVSVFNILPYIGRKYLEILVENRLRRNTELYNLIVVHFEGNIQEHLPESIQFLEEILLPVHIRGVRPDNRSFRKQVGYACSRIGTILRHQVGKYLYLILFLLGKLCIAVEYMDFLNLVAEERNPVGIIEGE